MRFVDPRRSPKGKMSKRKPTRAELEAENKFLKRHRNSRSVASIINNLIRWGGVVGVSYFIFLSIEALAGETTAADIGINLLADVRLSEVFAVLFGGGGVIYGIRQRSLRRSAVERLQGRVKKLEKQEDPGRTSSGLTPRGDTHPKDK